MKYGDDEKDKRVTQLRKGILELAVMGILYHERHYGYSLIRVLTERGSISLKEGTIYPILARLNQDGLVRSEWVESDQGPPRKYYSLSPSGRKLFDELQQEFALLVSLVKQEWSDAETPEDMGKKILVPKEVKQMNNYPEVVAKIIDDYLQRLKLQLRRVPAREQEEFLREIQSHLYEAYQQEPGEDEVVRALTVLRKLGEPAEVVSDRLPGAMVRSGTKRSLPIYVVGGILIALFGAPLGFGAVAVLAGVLAALTGVVVAYYAAAGMMLLVGVVTMLLGLTRIFEPAVWDRLIAAGFIQLNGPPAQVFEALSPDAQGFAIILFAAAFAAAGLGMMWLGRYLFLGLRFLYGLIFDWVRKMAQTIRRVVRERTGRESYLDAANASRSADATASGFSWERK